MRDKKIVALLSLTFIALLILLAYSQYQNHIQQQNFQQALLTQNKQLEVLLQQLKSPSDMSKAAEKSVHAIEKQRGIQSTPELTPTEEKAKPVDPIPNREIITKQATEIKEKTDTSLAEDKIPTEATDKVQSIDKTNKPNELVHDIQQCKKHYQEKRLTYGEPGNAYDCYMNLLSSYPQNKEILSGIKKIENYYTYAIKRDLKLKKYDKVKRFLESLKKVNPENDQYKYLYERYRLESEQKPETSIAPLAKKRLANNQLDKAERQSNQPIAMIHLKPGCYFFAEKADKKSCIQNPFALGKYEVTQGLWKKVMGNNPSRFKNCGDNCPVENISWFEVQKFIRELNKSTGEKYRLPTEKEWEYAAKAGSGYKKITEKTIHQYANFCDQQCRNEWREAELNDGYTHTAPVGSLTANDWGLYDMQGNVWEWVQDKFDNKENQHVYRGGSWGDSKKLCTTVSRGGAAPDLKVSGLGFRLAKTIN